MPKNPTTHFNVGSVQSQSKPKPHPITEDEAAVVSLSVILNLEKRFNDLPDDMGTHILDGFKRTYNILVEKEDPLVLEQKMENCLKSIHGLLNLVLWIVNETPAPVPGDKLWPVSGLPDLLEIGIKKAKEAQKLFSEIPSP